mgnify:CR=1 FL=1
MVFQPFDDGPIEIDIRLVAPVDTSPRPRKEAVMTDAEETVRCWLVERSSFGDERMVTLVYAPPKGDRHLRKQLSPNLLMRKRVTAAEDVEPDRLEPVDDAATRERYATEAARMADRHDPDDEV